MPNKAVTAVLERIAVLETKVESLMAYHKWEMGLLAAVLGIAIKIWMK